VPTHRLASFVLAGVLVPAGCVTPVPCADPHGVCLALDDITHVRVGFRPDALVVIDVDGDGARDLAAASGRAGTITVVWGDGQGFTGSAATWSIDQEVAGIVVADVDDDGRLDLATAVPRADAVAVLRGRGGRSFADPTRHPTGATPRAVLAADLDGAGPPELVTANLGDGTVTVLQQLVAGPPLVVGPGPRALAAGDLDSDGQLDVAVALADADAVQVMRGDGRGGLSPAALHPVGAAPYGLVVADLDADGDLDLATADRLDDTVSVLFGDGAGELDGRTAWPTAPYPSGLAVSQSTDSQPVLGVLSESTSTVERLDPRTGDTLAGVLATDPTALVDDQGALVTAGGAISGLSEGTGIVVTELWRHPAREVFPVDVDGDGVDELLVRETRADPGLQMTLYRGDASVPVELTLEYPEAVHAAELTGDDRVDLLLVATGSLEMAVQQPDGTFVTTSIAAPGLADAVPADIDADGVAEVLALADSNGISRLDVYRSDDTGTLVLSESTSFVVDEPPDELQVIDGDGDDVPDLLLRHSYTHYLAEDVFGPVHELSWLNGFAPQGIRPVDLDQDGRLDAVYATSQGVFAHFDFLGEYALPVPLFDTRVDDLDILDLDQDGDLDILVRTVTSRGPSLTVRLAPWLADEDAGWQPAGTRVVKNLVYAQVVAELDGDPGPELVLRSFDEFAAVDLALGSVLLEAEHSRLMPRPSLRFGDLDGDGAADLLAFGESVAVARAEGHGSFGPLSQILQLYTPSYEAAIVEGLLFEHADGAGPRFVWNTRRYNSPGDLFYASDLNLAGLGQPAAIDGAFSVYLQMYAADVDGDDARDVLVLDTNFALEGYLSRGREDGGFEAFTHFVLDEQRSFNRVGLHDMNRDGHVDIVVSFSAITTAGVLVYPGVGDGTFGVGEPWSDWYANFFDRGRLVLGDFDRDGRVELISHDAAGTLHWIRGGASRGVRHLLGGVDAYDALDLDRDGYPELVAAGNDSGSARLHVGRSRSDGSFGFTDYLVPTTDVREVDAADVDGDGELDIILVDDLGATIVRRRP